MSSKTKTKQQETSKVDPWAPAIPYLTEGLSNASGIFKKYQNLSEGQQDALQAGKDAATSRLGSGIFGKIGDAASSLVGGDFAPTLTQPGAIKAATASPSVGSNVQSAIDRTLSGQVDNPQLQRMAEAATRTGQRAYGDAVEDSTTALTESILPAIRSGAQMAGGYGGSRQGIAEGRALAERERTLGRNARELGIASEDAAAGIFGQAYESAQNRMASMADAEAARAAALAEGNANRAQQAGMFNVGTEFQNNQQALEAAQQRAQQALQGAGLFGQGAGMQDDTINSLLGLEGYPAEWEMNLLNPYISAITGIGGLGRQGESTMTGTTKSSNPMQSLTNLAMAAAMFVPGAQPLAAAGMAAGR